MSTWRRIDAENAPKGRSSHSVAVVPTTRRVYIYGGEDVPRHAFDPEMHFYDFNTNTWTKVQATGDLPPARLAHTSSVVGDTIFVFGGRKTHGATPIQEAQEELDLQDLYAFDTTKNHWTHIQPKEGTGPSRRSYHSSTSNQDSLFVFGGCQGHDRLNDLWKFSPKTQEWTLVSEKSKKLPNVRGGPGLCALQDKVYLHGGYQGSLGESDDLWEFDLNSGEWKELHPDLKSVEKPAARSVHSVISVGKNGKNRLFTWGGEGAASKTGHMGAGEYFGDGWYYDVEQQKWREAENDETRRKQGNEARPSPRGWFSMDRLDDNHVVLFGGFDGTKGDERLGDLYVFETEE